MRWKRGQVLASIANLFFPFLLKFHSISAPIISFNANLLPFLVLLCILSSFHYLPYIFVSICSYSRTSVYQVSTNNSLYTNSLTKHTHTLRPLPKLPSPNLNLRDWEKQCIFFLPYQHPSTLFLLLSINAIHGSLSLIRCTILGKSLLIAIFLFASPSHTSPQEA